MQRILVVEDLRSENDPHFSIYYMVPLKTYILWVEIRTFHASASEQAFVFLVIIKFTFNILQKKINRKYDKCINVEVNKGTIYT